MTARKNQNLMRDLKNHYLHLIVTPGSDSQSVSKLQDLLELNTMLKFSVKHFQTAVVQFNCKKNSELRDQLFKVCLSCQRGL